MAKQKADKNQTPSLLLPALNSPLRGYEEFLRDLKAHIRSAQTKAILSVNRELILLYWQIGRDILRHQKEEGWGAKVIDRLAVDLRRAFPEMQGFSSHNLKYMRAFSEAYPEEQFVQQVAAQIPWFHNCLLLDKVKDTGCKGKNKTIAEYALRDMKKPMGISEYRFTKRLPKDLVKELPAPRDLQKLIEEEK